MRAKWSISMAVHAFRCRRGNAACRSRVIPRYQSNGLPRMHAADDVQLGAAGVGRLLGRRQQLGLAHRVGPRIVLVAAVGAQAQR